MSKKKKNQNSSALFCQEIFQELFQNDIMTQNLMTDNKSDCFQQAEANEKEQEQERYLRVLCEMMKLSKLFEDMQKEMQEVKKYIKDLERASVMRDKFEHDMKKLYKNNSKKVGKHDMKLKKSHKQQEELIKTVCFMATLLGVGNVSQDLHKIQKRCIKEIERGNEVPCFPNPKQKRIIEGTCREV